MARKCLLPAEQRPRVFPESAGDFPGEKEGESKQPSPARIPMGKSSCKTSSRYLLRHPRAVPCPWVFHGVLNPWISHPRGVLDLLERAGCWLGLLEEVGKAGATGGVLRCRSLFRGRLIQRGLSWYPAGSPSHGPGSAEPKPIHAVLQLRIHRWILLCRLLTRCLPSLSIHCFPPWHCFPTSPHPWARSVPVTPHRAPAGASHARRRLQEWPFLLLLFPAAARSSRVFPCGSAAGGSSGSCSRT